MAALQAWSTRSMKRALATYCCCENASKIVSDLHAMRHSDVTAGQRTCFGQNRQIPPGLQDNLVLTNEFRHPVTTSIKRVIFNLSELAGYWAHMMRKGTGAPFVIMPDGREGKMVLEYVRWWASTNVFLLLARNQQVIRFWAATP